MPEDVQLDAGDKDLMMRLCNFAARKAVNGVYMGQFYSASLGTPVLLIVGLGDQAMALQQVVMSAAVPDEAALLERPAASEFMKDQSNGGS